MSYRRVACLIVSLIWTAGISGSVPQSRSEQRDKPLFENPNFKVFSVPEMDELPSISKDSNFGVLIFNYDSSGSPMGGSCGFCFTGPTGSRNVLVYGTPRGVIPIANKQFAYAQHPFWIAVKPDTELAEEVFDPDLDRDFRFSVRADLFAIGSLADRVRSGAKPTDRDQTRANAALRDLDVKSKWFSQASGHPSSLFINVKVHTVKAGKEIKNWTVSYVLDGWEGDQDHTYDFDRESSPTEQKIVPGPYKMWASRGKKRGPSKAVTVGDTPDLTKELELELP